MKKNRMMRLASVLLVAVLLTTCAISGTFAKYVTEASATDSARVAKFGVVVTASGYLFDDHDPITATGTSVTVEAANGIATDEGDRVLAPGTKHDADDANCLTFSITGTPEVDVQVAFSTNATTTDIFLPAYNSYVDYTTNPTGTFAVPEGGYYPVKFTLWRKNGNASVYSEVDSVNLKDTTLKTITDYLTSSDRAAEFRFDSNTNLATAFGSYMITWKWDFEDATRDWVDEADTFLGNHAADSTTFPMPAAVTEYVGQALVNLTLTVTQIDNPPAPAPDP